MIPLDHHHDHINDNGDGLVLFDLIITTLYLINYSLL